MVSEISNKDTLIQGVSLKKRYAIRKAFGVSSKPKAFVHAVDGVDLKIYTGEVLGVVGESGCGKTTLGKMLIRLLEPTDGKLTFCGIDITHLSNKEMKAYRGNMQMIFQNPFSSLPVRYTIEQILIEPLIIHKKISKKEEGVNVAAKLLQDVGLTPADIFLQKHPNTLSGGQRQRLSIARAIALNPRFIVADEPVSMLDLSVRADILNLLSKLKREHQLTMMLITHDLASAQYMCNMISIMYVGKIVELGPGKEILQLPYHPYTMLLKSALPTLNPLIKHHLRTLPGEGDLPNPLCIPTGCTFHPRCPYAKDICKRVIPVLRDYDGRQISCHGIEDWIDPKAIAEELKVNDIAGGTLPSRKDT